MYLENAFRLHFLFEVLLACFLPSNRIAIEKLWPWVNSVSNKKKIFLNCGMWNLKIVLKLFFRWSKTETNIKFIQTNYTSIKLKINSEHLSGDVRSQ